MHVAVRDSYSYKGQFPMPRRTAKAYNIFQDRVTETQFQAVMDQEVKSIHSVFVDKTCHDISGPNCICSDQNNGH